MNDLQGEQTVVILDSIVAIDVGFCGVENSHAYTGIVAENILRSGSAVSAIQYQVGGAGADPASAITGHAHCAVHIESAAVDADSGPRAVGDRAVKNMNQGVNAGDADTSAVLDRDGIEINARIVIDENAAATGKGDALDPDPL